MGESGELAGSRSAPSPSASGEARADAGEHIDLDLPADPSVLSLVRLTVGVVAARADLSIEDVDDLRLATEELFLSLWRSALVKPERLLFRFTWDRAGVEVHCRFVPGEGPAEGDAPRAGRGHGDVVSADAGDHDTPSAWLPAELSAQILEALVDEHGLDAGVPGASGWVRKGRAPATD